jgi:hypothetical protein
LTTLLEPLLVTMTTEITNLRATVEATHAGIRTGICPEAAWWIATRQEAQVDSLDRIVRDARRRVARGQALEKVGLDADLLVRAGGGEAGP